MRLGLGLGLELLFFNRKRGIFPPFYLNAQHYLFYNYRLLKILFNLQIDKTQHHHDQRAT